MCVSVSEGELQVDRLSDDLHEQSHVILPVGRPAGKGRRLTR